MTEPAPSIEADIRAAYDQQAWESAVTIAIRHYGPELLGYLNVMLRNAAEADDVFGTVCEKLWSAMPRFAWHSTFRTWAYTVTRNACVSFVRGARTRTGVPLSHVSSDALAAEVRSRTATFLRTETKDKLAEIRDALDPDDHTLLILRIDRHLPWRDIAQVFEGDAASPASIAQRAAALRKRFERLKLDLRERLGR